jgi:diguanylate cyclase (GGDEF)-like protein
VNGGDGNILLLSDEQVAAELGSRIASDGYRHHADPYEALEELAGKRYQTVILTHPYPDFASLVRAIRRLQPSARTFALCSPAGEADLSISGPNELDDYFIYPPSREELEAMLRPGAPAPTAPGAPEQLMGVSPEDIAGLIQAANSVAGLAGQVRQLVADWTGRQLRWAGADEAAQGGQELLLLDGDQPQVLVSDDPTPLPPRLSGRLQALQLLLGSLAGQARRTEALHRLAITDHLTGAHNRRYFYRFTDQLLDRAKSERFRVTLLLFDIDDLKRYNDAYGHAVGDEILRETTALMKQVTRQHDIVARIGGDEFAVLFWDAEPPRRPDSQHPQDVHAIAARFVKALKAHEFGSLGPEAKGALTISGGLATFPWDGKNVRELLRHADVALGEAKRTGKNAIHLVGKGDINNAAEEPSR